MDILTLISTPIPAYFTLGPLVVLLIILATLTKKASSVGAVPAQTAAGAAVLATEPQGIQKETEALSQATPSSQTEAPVTTPVPPAIPPISSWKPAEPVAIPQEAVPTPVSAVEVAQVTATAAEPAKPTF